MYYSAQEDMWAKRRMLDDQLASILPANDPLPMPKDLEEDDDETGIEGTCSKLEEA